MTRKEAEKQAREISEKEGCVQHVNIQMNIRNFNDDGPADFSYYVSDWYNCDSTVASYENGFKL